MSLRTNARRSALGTLLVALAAAATTTGCATNGASAPPSTAPQRRSSVLTQDEIEKSQITNLYDVVRSLRPRWMQTRGTDSLRQPTQIQVYVGGQHLNGGLESLREMSSMNVAKVEFFDPAQASARWGTGHGEGAIVVTLASR